MQRRFYGWVGLSGRRLAGVAAATVALVGFASALTSNTASAQASSGSSGTTAAPVGRNVIIIVCDGLRAGSVTQANAPTLYSLERRGVRFANSHSLFPTVTTPNASAFATGHYLGDTSDFSNMLFVGYPVFNTGNFGNPPGTSTPFLENDQILADVDDHFGGNYLTEETLLAYARQHGYATAAVGKQGPTLIQDVTQGNLDHATGKIDLPETIIIDDSTGKTGGVPLNSTITAALTSAGLPLVAPSRSNGADPNSRLSNGYTGTSIAPGTMAANVVQQKYFADAVTRAILPAFKTSGKPFALVFWSRDPDGTQHNQGDSLNRLTPGINGPTALAAVKNVDGNVAQIVASLDTLGLAGNTDVFVVADHGFNTISKHEISRAQGDVTHSYSAGFTYRSESGAQDVPTGFLPPGFLAIDLAHTLNLPLFDPDAQVKAASGAMEYKPIDPTLPQATERASQHSLGGNGLLGGSGAVASPLDAQVAIAVSGGSDLIYIPSHDAMMAGKIAAFLAEQDYVSGIFADDCYGYLPGALPLSAVNLKGEAKTPTPDIVVNFRTFATDIRHPYQSSIEIADTNLQEGQGMHGGFSRGDTFNFMAAFGPDFKKGFVDYAPVSNADVAITLAGILKFTLPAQGKLIGRVAGEALAGSPDIARGIVTRGMLLSQPAANGLRTELKYQQLGGTRYFDAAGFAGRTNGL